MSSYPPPSELTPIFNPLYYTYTNVDGGITQATADTLYVSLSKSQGINGSKTFNAPLTANSIVNITDTTQSTNATTGCLTLSGGLGILRNVHINGTAHLNAAGSELQLTGANSNIVMSGANGFESIANTSASTSSTTGALRIAGGLYAGANSLLGSDLSFAKSGFTNRLTSQALTSNRTLTLSNASGTLVLIDNQQSAQWKETTNQTIPDITVTTITFPTSPAYSKNNVITYSGGTFTVSANTENYGLWNVSFELTYENTNDFTTSFEVWIEHASIRRARQAALSKGANVANPISGSALVEVDSTNRTFQLRTYQNFGGNRVINGGSTTYISFYKLP